MYKRQAYNYGARKSSRIKQAVLVSVIAAVSIMLIGLALFQLIPSQLLNIFNASDNMTAIGVPALRIISLSYLLAGFCIISSSVFQSLGHGMLSLWVSVIRQLVVLLPAAYLLSRVGGLSAVWWAFPIAELFSFVLCVLFLRHTKKKEIDTLEQ